MPGANDRSRVNEIDLLRFLAAVSVMLFHYGLYIDHKHWSAGMSSLLLGPFAAYGFLAVQLFFMISGFVILMTAAHGDLKRFVVSRAARLYPGFWACCTLTFAAMAFANRSISGAEGFRYIANLTMLCGYFHVRAVDPVYWTLYCEIRFYALVAAVLLVRQIHRAETLLALWLILSVALCTHLRGILNFLFVIDYAAYFIAGATCFLIWRNGITWIRAAMLAGSWGLAMFHLGTGMADRNGGAGTYLTADPFVAEVIVTAFLVVLLLVALHKMGPVYMVNWMRLGALTYPLYLLHGNIGFVVLKSLHTHIGIQCALWVNIAGMLALAYAVNVCVERRMAKPMREILNRWLSWATNVIGRQRNANTGVRS